MVRECRVGTGWGTHGLAPVVATRIGSRAGDPFGDLIFNFLMVEIVSALGCRLQHEDLVLPLPWDGRPSFLFSVSFL